MLNVFLLLFLLVFPFLCGGGGFLHETRGVCTLVLWDIIVLGYSVWRIKRFRWTVPDVLMLALGVWGIFGFSWENGGISLLSGFEWLGVFAFYAVIRQGGWNRMLWYGIALSGMVQVFTGGCYFPNPGLYGGFLAMAWIVWHGLFLTEKRIFQVGRYLLFASGFMLLGWGGYCSDSRSAWLAVMAGSGWLLYGFYPGNFRKGWGWVRKHKWFLFVGCVVVTGGIFLLYVYKLGSVHGRWLIWQVAARMFAGAPWTGHGWGTFGKEYMYAQAACLREGNVVPGSIHAGDNWQAFNEGMHLLCELGIVGGLLTACLLFCLFRRIRAGSIAQAAGMGLLVFSAFSYPASVPALVIFYPLLAGVSVNESASVMWGYGRMNVFGRVVAGIVLVAGSWGGMYMLRVVRQAGNILEQSVRDKEKLPEALAYFPLMQERADYVLCLGRQLYKHGNYREAIPVLRQAATLRPTTGMLCDLGDCYRRMGQYAGAENCFLMARDMIPARLTARYHLFCLYRETEQAKKARAMAWEILQTKVKIVNSFTLDVKRESREYLKNARL